MSAYGLADVAVVGRGMVGCSAARHLAESGLRVVLIGPHEPEDYRTTNLPFGSHYDEGRIGRFSGENPLLKELAARSMRRFEEISLQSGVDFYKRCELLFLPGTDVGAEADKNNVYGDIRSVHPSKVFVDYGLDLEWLGLGNRVCVESSACIINPRKLMQAQSVLAIMSGAVVIDESVQEIQPKGNIFEVVTDGRTILASRILIATGAYGAELVGKGLRLERRLKTILLAETTRLDHVPLLLLNNLNLDSITKLYWVPPLLFPDGNRYIKVGGSLDAPKIADIADLQAWFASGASSDEGRALLEALRRLLPDVRIDRYTTKACVDAYTPSGYPYIGWIMEGIAVALGGNGEAAKSCDEIGRLASNLVRHGCIEDCAFVPGVFDPINQF